MGEAAEPLLYRHPQVESSSDLKSASASVHQSRLGPGMLAGSRDSMMGTAARTDVARDTQLPLFEFPSYELIRRPIRLHTILNKEHIQR